MIKKVTPNGKVRDYGYFDIVDYSRGYIVLEVTNTDKFMYEPGYRTKVKRKLNKKNLTIKYDNVTWDLSDVYGIKENCQ